MSLSSSFVTIAKTVLGSAAANITFSNIPTIYNRLYLVVLARSAAVATNDTLQLQVNGVVSGYVTSSLFQSGNNTVTAASSLSQTVVLLGTVPAASATASTVGVSSVWLISQKNTTDQKVIMSNFVSFWTPGTGLGENRVTMSYNTTNSNAITSIVILLSSASNLVANTVAILYGQI